MRKTLFLSAALAVLLAVGGVSLAGASSNAKDDHPTRVIELTAKTVQIEHLDLGKSGHSLGDRFVFSDDVFDDDKQVGTDGGECVVVRIEPADAKEANITAVTHQCVVTLSLPEGQIMAQGLMTVEHPPTAAPFTLAITGGTGDFRTAHGEVKVAEKSETVAQLTVMLIL